MYVGTIDRLVTATEESLAWRLQTYCDVSFAAWFRCEKRIELFVLQSTVSVSQRNLVGNWSVIVGRIVDVIQKCHLTLIRFDTVQNIRFIFSKVNDASNTVSLLFGYNNFMQISVIFLIGNANPVTEKTGPYLTALCVI